MQVQIGFKGLPTTTGFSGKFEGNLKPPPSNAEILRQIADSVEGDDPMKTIFAGVLRSAAAELDAYHEAFKLAVGTLVLHGHEGEAKEAVTEYRQRKDAQPESAGREAG